MVPFKQIQLEHMGLVMIKRSFVLMSSNMMLMTHDHFFVFQFRVNLPNTTLFMQFLIFSF